MFALFVSAAGDNGDSKECTPSHHLQEDDSDCPRDSGCFISSECLDSKEETEQLTDTVYSWFTISYIVLEYFQSTLFW